VLAASWHVAYSQEVYKFELEVRTVYLDVFVTRKGEPVSGLRADNFDVRDSGVRQRVDLLDIEEVPISALLILDTSGSLIGRSLTDLQTAGHAFLDGLSEKDEAGLLGFSHRLQLLSESATDLEPVHQALDRTEAGGLTSLHDALFAGLKLVEDSEGRPLIVLFTDGQDNMSWISERDALNMVRESEAVIYVVGIRPRTLIAPTSRTGGPAPSPDLHGRRGLSALASRGARTPSTPRFPRKVAELSGGRLVYADSSSKLEEAFLSIHSEMRTRYLLSYTPQGVPEPGWHELEVKVRNLDADVRSRPGYFAPSDQ
jgi:VWFA-related protein